MIFLLLYCLGFFSFLIFDAFIGFDIDWDKEECPVIFAAFCWPASFVIGFFIKFYLFLERVKEERFKKGK